MSIHNISKTAFTDIVKDILLHNTFVSVHNPDKITADTSFRNELDITSFDIAELLVELENRYGLNLGNIETEKIDTINDVYNCFIANLQNRRKTATFGTTLQTPKAKEHKKYTQQNIFEILKNHHILSNNALSM